jgi:hypothetical protein
LTGYGKHEQLTIGYNKSKFTEFIVYIISKDGTISNTKWTVDIINEMNDIQKKKLKLVLEAGINILEALNTTN